MICRLLPHELSHRIDKLFLNVENDTIFVEKVKGAKQTIDSDPKKFQQFCIDNDEEGFYPIFAAQFQKASMNFLRNTQKNIGNRKGSKKVKFSLTSIP